MQNVQLVVWTSSSLVSPPRRPCTPSSISMPTTRSSCWRSLTRAELTSRVTQYYQLSYLETKEQCNLSLVQHVRKYAIFLLKKSAKHLGEITVDSVRAFVKANALPLVVDFNQARNILINLLNMEYLYIIYMLFKLIFSYFVLPKNNSNCFFSYNLTKL